MEDFRSEILNVIYVTVLSWGNTTPVVFPV